MELKFKHLNEIRAIEPQSPENTTIRTVFNKIEKGYVVVRTIENTSTQAVNLFEQYFRLEGIVFGARAEDDYFYSNENGRIYGTMTLPLDFDRVRMAPSGRREVIVNTKWADPGTTGKRICASPYQPFPAILISNYNSKYGLIVGSLSQDVFFHNFETGHDGKAYLDIYSSFKGIDCRVLQPGEVLTDSFCILETERADDVNGVFGEYTELLRDILRGGHGATDINRHTMVWDSWNDGIYRNVSEDMLVAEAKAVKKYFPNVEWFQLDDGYSAFCDANPDLAAHGIGVAYEGNEGVDKVKFPHGLKGYSDRIRECGLKPSIWIGGFCPVKSKIYLERPEWFIDYTYRVDFSQPLDVSREDVREYMTSAFDLLVAQAGFDGVKHDFWSYAFEDSHNIFYKKDKSGYEYRTWWLREMRNRIPENGYLQSCCDLSLGSPFLGEYFNNYRFGLDVGSGKWENVKTTMFWSVSVLSIQTGDMFIPNSDSIGMLPGLNDTDFMFVVNFQIITRTIVEISGRFSRVDENNLRLRILQRATKYLNNGEKVFFAKYDYRKSGMNLPEIIYIDSAFDGSKDTLKTVALFNAEEESKQVSFSSEDVGLNGSLTFENVWDEDCVSAERYCKVLPPHGSVLLKIKK